MPSTFNFSNRKIGGIRFMRLGRLQLSFCITRKPVTVVRHEPGMLMDPAIGPFYVRSMLMSDGSRRFVRC
jgi:hypothetical protein